MYVGHTNFYKFQHSREKRLLAPSCPSVSPHRSAKLSLDECRWNLILRTYMKIIRQNTNFVKVWHQYRVPWWRLFCRRWYKIDITTLSFEWKLYQSVPSALFFDLHVISVATTGRISVDIRYWRLKNICRGTSNLTTVAHEWRIFCVHT